MRTAGLRGLFDRVGPRLARPAAWLRRRFRASEGWFILLAVLVGVAAGLTAVIQGQVAHLMQQWLYGFRPDQRLSAFGAIHPLRLLWLPVGGLVLGLFGAAVARRPPRAMTDVVEANALYGGRMSLRDSAVVCLQTLLSNGFGASVGLEAAYAQAGGAAASALGQRLKLRRQDLRTLVGAGAGAAIGAAFGAPLTGAFYAFEIVIGSYAPSMIAPVAAAALASVLTAKAMGAAPYAIHVVIHQTLQAADYLLYAGLGAVCAALGVAMMLLVAQAEQAVKALKVPAWSRPAIGGCILAALAVVSPQTLSAGHGALHLDLLAGTAIGLLASVLILKAAASIVALGFGFRGGLFFASLFLGSLVGQLYAQAVNGAGLPMALDPQNAALVGMGALAAAVVGGPLTMSFLVLEATQDFALAAATLTAAVVAGAVVRERFGYSFSTWRLHLRGETIRSARDVGWTRSLTAGRMMRRGVATAAASTSLAEFRRRFPLGSTSRVILVDDAGRYAGMAVTASAYAGDRPPQTPVSDVAVSQDATLSPEMDIVAVMSAFERHETEELAVVADAGQVVGLLAETYVSRRYARELEKVQQELFGEI